MKAHKTDLDGVLLLEPDVFRDSRGFFLEAWNPATLKLLGLSEGSFVQSNHSRSSYGVIRGLHFQRRIPQGKLVQVIHGTAFDVAVDIRRDSRTFGKWVSRELSGTNNYQMWIPPGFAHGFCAISESVDLVYYCTEIYKPELDTGIIWNDAQIGVNWPLDEVMLSPKDKELPTLVQAATNGLLPESSR